MRKLLPFVFLILLISSCKENIPWKNTIEAMNLQGDIEWIDERFTTLFDGRMVPASGSLRYFTEDGWVDNEVTYTKGNEFESRNKFSHDASGKPISVTRHDEEGNLTYKVKIAYNEKTRQTTTDAFLPEGQYLTYRIRRQFDHNWLDVEESVSGSDGNVIMFTQKTRDKNGNIIKVRQSDGKETQEIVQDFFYNEENLAISSYNATDPSGNFENTFTYKFDEQGNWTEKAVTKGGKVMEMTSRAFGYR